jgi:transcriptional regulator with XRE-family HTH domain
MVDESVNIGRVIRQRRLMTLMTLRDLSVAAGVSSSHLGRIERGERFPSGRTLRKIAGPLGFSEVELFTWANYLPSESSNIANNNIENGRLDPYVAMVLSQEPREVQKAALTILSMIKYAVAALSSKQPGITQSNR